MVCCCNKEGSFTQSPQHVQITCSSTCPKMSFALQLNSDSGYCRVLHTLRKHHDSWLNLQSSLIQFIHRSIHWIIDSLIHEAYTIPTLVTSDCVIPIISKMSNTGSYPLHSFPRNFSAQEVCLSSLSSCEIMTMMVRSGAVPFSLLIPVDFFFSSFGGTFTLKGHVVSWP